MPEKIFQGVAASGGIGIGPVYLYHPLGFSAPRRTLRPEEVEAETVRYREALAKTKTQILELETRMQEKLGDSTSRFSRPIRWCWKTPSSSRRFPRRSRNEG